MLNVLKGKKYEILETVSSTNDYIKNKDLFCVIAKEQTGGKGTNNRKFYSPKGGLYLSVKLPLNLTGEDFLLLTPLVAVITANAIDKIAGVKTEIKWVNDIYLNGKKLGGILCENLISNGVSQVVIGIGVNVLKQAFPPLNLNEPISLEEVVGIVDINRLIAELLVGFDGFEDRLKERDFLATYNAKFYLKGKPISVSQNGKITTGVCEGIDSKASLILDTNNGLKSFTYGDVKIIK